MQFVLYALTLFGFCYIVGRSKITQGIRRRLARVCYFNALTCLYCKSTNAEEKIGNSIDMQFVTFTCKDCKLVSGNPAWYPFRWPITLAECPACLSTWIGFIFAFARPQVTMDLAGPYFANAFLFALLSCGSSAFLGFITGLME